MTPDESGRPRRRSSFVRAMMEAGLPVPDPEEGASGVFSSLPRDWGNEGTFVPGSLQGSHGTHGKGSLSPSGGRGSLLRLDTMQRIRAGKKFFNLKGVAAYLKYIKV